MGVSENDLAGAARRHVLSSKANQKVILEVVIAADPPFRDVSCCRRPCLSRLSSSRRETHHREQ
jgi:hypothetical protein